MPDHGDRQSELVGSVFGRIVLARIECDIHRLDECRGILCPFIEGKQRPHLVGGDVARGALRGPSCQFC